MSRCCATLIVAISVFTYAPAAVQAQAQNESLDEAARLTFQEGREAFVGGDYERALGLFRQAYELSQRPGLLYNIAQTLDRLRRDAEALQALRDYLEAYPDAPNRAEVEARINVLDAQVSEDEQREEARRREEEERQRQQASSGSSTPPPQTDDGGGLAILHPAIFIAVGGVALVGGGLAIWAGLETSSLNDAYTNDTNPVTVGDSYDEANSMQTLANVFIFSSIGLATTAVVLAIFTDWGAFDGGGDSSASLTPSIAVTPNGGAIGLGGTF